MEFNKEEMYKDFQTILYKKNDREIECENFFNNIHENENVILLDCHR